MADRSIFLIIRQWVTASHPPEGRRLGGLAVQRWTAKLNLRGGGGGGGGGGGRVRPHVRRKDAAAHIPWCVAGADLRILQRGGGGSGTEFFKGGGGVRVQVRGNFHILTSKTPLPPPLEESRGGGRGVICPSIQWRFHWLRMESSGLRLYWTHYIVLTLTRESTLIEVK